MAELILDPAQTKDSVAVVEFEVRHGERSVPGALWRPESPSPGAPWVCFGHGASGDRHQAPIPGLARRLVREHGYFCIAIDGPVHGRRQVGPGGRKAFWPEWQRPGSAEEMVSDWQAVLERLAEEPDIGAGPVGYWGLSMGTIYGAPLVAEEPRIQVAVLGLMGLCGPEIYRSVLDAAAQRIRCPVFFLQQLEDELFGREAYAALFDRLASADKRLHANPGLHPEVPGEELDQSLRFLTDYLEGRSWSRRSAFAVSE